MPGIRHAWTTNGGPDFAALPSSPEQAASVSILARAVDLPRAAWVRQVHGDGVRRASGAGYQGEADALWSTQPGLAVVGRGADCPLILVGGRRDDGGTLWGFAHASWRSTVAGITGRLLDAMTGAGMRADAAHAVICPAAGSCCYEVGTEVRELAIRRLGPGAATFFTKPEGRHHFDLSAANVAQLVAAGLDPRSIHAAGICTICGGPDYPSYRRDGADAGRFAAIVGGDHMLRRY